MNRRSTNRGIGCQPIVHLLLLSATLCNAETNKVATTQQFLENYCVQCHGETKQKGDLRLDKADTFDVHLWKDIYEQLASGEMPPDDEKQPGEVERKELMKAVLQLAVEKSPATVTGFRRLNKREYGHTVRDLLGLRQGRQGIFDPGEYIYDDEIEDGFDTQAESLVISNELLLEYMGAAEKSLRHALFSSDTEKPDSKVSRVNLAKAKGTSRRYINHGKDHVICRSGGKAKIHDGSNSPAMEFPGRYTITLTASGVDRDSYPVKFTPAKGPLVMGVGILPHGSESLSNKGIVLKTFELKDDEEQTFQIDTWIDKGHFPYVSFVNGSDKPITQIRSNIRRRKIPADSMKKPFRGPGIRISQFKVEGPFHDVWPPKSFVTTYDAKQIPNLRNSKAREQIIRRFAKRAFRRPVASEEIAPYLAYLDKQYSTSRDYHDALIKTLAAMMASIDFLYIREEQGELTPHQLASRLSYFLWSTMPDDALFKLADNGQLKDPSVLSSQVSRLLCDARAGGFANAFTDQWLSIDTLGSMPPDTKAPQFKAYQRDDLEQAMREETRRFFAHVLKENRSVRDFIDSDYSFLNQGLANLYGVPFDGGSDFIRVNFPAGVKRGGLLGQGSILTLTSNGVETSPVVRGHWVLDELLGTPPPPAPKEVPALVPDLNGADTVRELLAQHRTDPACMECHRQMDPLGLALEAYDPIGRYRTTYSKTQKVTTYGNYKGEDFTDIEGLKKIMLRDIRPFARNLTIRIAEYAKGRKLDATDFLIIEEIIDKTSVSDFRLRDIIVQVATSDLLLTR